MTVSVWLQRGSGTSPCGASATHWSFCTTAPCSGSSSTSALPVNLAGPAFLLSEGAMRLGRLYTSLPEPASPSRITVQSGTLSSSPSIEPL